MPVAESCSHIVAWCHEHARTTAESLRPAATPDRIDAAEQHAPGLRWPEDLRQLYRQFDGAAIGSAFLYVRGYAITLDTLVDEYRWLNNFWGPREHTDDIRRHVRENERDEAGEVAGIWLPQFLPIAPNGDGGYLFVDTREGIRSGCVGFWDDVARDEPQLWDSVESMLDQISATLTEQTDVLDEYPVVRDDQTLTWMT